MKTTDLPLADAPNGSEEVIINQGAGTAAETKRMPAAAFAAAGTRPSPDELRAALLGALIAGNNITFVDNGDGTTGIRIADNADLPGVPKAATAAPGTNTRQIATTAHVKATVDALATVVAAKQGELVEGVGVHIADNGDGTFTISATGGGGGGGLVDGTYGDVVVSGGGTVLTVRSATNATITVPDEAYAAAWAGKLSPPTKNALYNKLEALAATINNRVANSAVGAANGVASLDATGKVPAAQLPSYVDDVLEYPNSGAFPNPGESGKIYVAIDTNLQWRWSGTAYVQITASPGTTDNVPEGPTNKYYTDVRVRAAVMTGLADTAGTPAQTDSLLTILGKLRQQAYGTLVTGKMDKAGGTFTGAVTFNADGTFNGLSLSAFAGIYGWSHNRAASPGQAGFHLYNGGGVTEWIAYQPAHAAGDDYRVATLVAGTITDRLRLAADGTLTLFGSVTSPSMGDFTTPGAGSTGGLRVRAQANNAVAYIQVTNNAASAEWGTFAFTNGACTWSGGMTAANFTYASDRRLKSNIRPLEGDGAAVLALKPSRYEKDGREQIGLIAQEVEEVIPEAVVTAGDEMGLKALDLGPLVAELIARVQFLDAEVARLKAAAA